MQRLEYSNPPTLLSSIVSGKGRARVRVGQTILYHTLAPALPLPLPYPCLFPARALPISCIINSVRLLYLIPYPCQSSMFAWPSALLYARTPTPGQLQKRELHLVAREYEQHSARSDVVCAHAHYMHAPACKVDVGPV